VRYVPKQMAKLVLIDGIPHRMRRGKLVAIPADWQGRVPHPQTIRKRPAKQTGKAELRREAASGRARVARPAERAASMVEL
jgi:hypothetical protein